MYGDDTAIRVGAGVGQLTAQVLDVGIYGTVIAIIGLTEGSIHQLATRKHFAGVARQRRQQAELGRCQAQGPVMAGRLVALLVYRQITDDDLLGHDSATFPRAGTAQVVHDAIRAQTAGLSSADAIRQAILLLCEWMDEYQDEMIVMNHEVGNLTREEREPLLDSERRNVALYEEILIRGNETGEFGVADTQTLAHTTYLAVRAWADRRWYLRKLYSLAEYAERLAEMTIAAARPAGSRREASPRVA